MAQQRIYLVGTPDNKVRLIKASVRQQAISHVANTMLTVRVASQDDLVKALTNGIEIEQYRAPEQPELIESSESPAN
jgi:hypothetical protein